MDFETARTSNFVGHYGEGQEVHSGCGRRQISFSTAPTTLSPICAVLQGLSISPRRLFSVRLPVELAFVSSSGIAPTAIWVLQLSEIAVSSFPRRLVSIVAIKDRADGFTRIQNPRRVRKEPSIFSGDRELGIYSGIWILVITSHS